MDKGLPPRFDAHLDLLMRHYCEIAVMPGHPITLPLGVDKDMAKAWFTLNGWVANKKFRIGWYKPEHLK